MSKQWIRQPGHQQWVEHSLWFAWADHPGSGFSFDCDAQGNVDASKLTACGIANLEACLAGVMDGRAILAQGVQTRDRKFYDSGSIRCGCGAEVELDAARHGPHYAASCDCGRLFNLCGQELVPVSQWED